ncbi:MULTISPECIES: hypothetical protein [Citrobacter freundii complex]|uniref:hypothetical protein n=1 Tax=Citrobacter freundii complex TaxID=1344959 RepID=UPI001902ECD3|nr:MULTISPECIES: hypothetical protein [Citrobacter freundii complex]EGT0622067.1 hypothetical protein [Citrobacter braakii]EKQ7208779.1 hypothetical protein [Citrobacter freundii]MBJ8846393.1 hypothetical protein [Citrobacter braakii]MDT7337035.1 hypothetical protein [Citrobacter freundii]HCB1564212.1 hypothetical protein [Citrobacter freundii]
MTVLMIAVLALAIAIWHEINRFPATNKSLLRLQAEMAELKDENKELSEQISLLREEMKDMSNTLERLKDPEFYALLDAGDGHGLYELEKSCGEI